MHEAFAPLLGESVWHAVTQDPSLEEVSQRHLAEVLRVLRRHGRHLPDRPVILEAGAYAHTTGYELAARFGAQVTLLDVAARTLRVGRESAEKTGKGLEQTRLVAADFHQLPFGDGEFHLVYVCSALHHASDWKKALSELLRVLAPGGLLFLENEPCLRELCFYKFRTNRPARFTLFESRLEALGLLRTVAEPYVGSRPETLFGMIENQTIGLDELHSALAGCDVREVQVMPEYCMGAFERTLMAKPRDAAALSAELRTRLEAAAAAFTETDRGLGFALPEPQEVDSLAQRMAPRLQALHRARVQRCLQRADSVLYRLTGQRRLGSQPFRMELARVFGAGVRLVARKRGEPPRHIAGRLQQTFPEEGGVVLGFAPSMLRFLHERNRVFPDLQSAAMDILSTIFPAPDWELLVSSDGTRNAITRGPRAVIRAALPAVPMQLFFRVQATRTAEPYRLRLLLGERELTGMDIFQTEFLLLSAAYEASGTEPVPALAIAVSPLDGTADTAPQARVSVSYAGSAATTGR